MAVRKSLILDKWDAIVNPDASNDGYEGYQVGSRWYNVVSTKEFVCIDDAIDAAIWKQTTHESDNATLHSAVETSTSSSSFQDSFSDGYLSPDISGDYLCLFEAQVSGSNNNTQIEIAIGKNGTASAEVGTERVADIGSKSQNMTVTAVIAGLISSDTVHGIFRKSSGAGSVKCHSRRITILKVKDA